MFRYNRESQAITLIEFFIKQYLSYLVMFLRASLLTLLIVFFVV